MRGRQPVAQIYTTFCLDYRGAAFRYVKQQIYNYFATSFTLLITFSLHDYYVYFKVNAVAIGCSENGELEKNTCVTDYKL